MRFASFKKRDGHGWICYCIVKTWRPIYARWNQRFAKADNLAEWVILDEETYQKWTSP